MSKSSRDLLEWKTVRASEWREQVDRIAQLEREREELLAALDSALRLAGVPEHAQDDEWQAEYGRLVEYEQARRSRTTP